MSLIEVSLIIFTLSLPGIVWTAFWARMPRVWSGIIVYIQIVALIGYIWNYLGGSLDLLIGVSAAVILVLVAISNPGPVRFLVALAVGVLGIYFDNQGVKIPTENLNVAQLERYALAGSAVMAFVLPFVSWFIPRGLSVPKQFMDRVSTLLGVILINLLAAKLNLAPEVIATDNYVYIGCTIGLLGSTILLIQLLTVVRLASCMSHSLLTPFTEMAEELYDADGEYISEEISSFAGLKEDYFHWLTNKLITSAAETQTSVKKAIEKVEKLSQLFKSDKVSPRDFRIDAIAHQTLTTLEKLIHANRTTPAQTEELTVAADNLRDAFREYQSLIHPQRLAWINGVLQEVADSVQTNGSVSQQTADLEKAREMLEQISIFAQDFETETLLGDSTSEAQRKISAMLNARQAIYGVAQEILSGRQNVEDVATEENKAAAATSS